jgi:hypothetical protein
MVPYLQVSRFCVFDHFPYTKHSECGVYLKKRPPREAGRGMQGH